MNRKNIIGLLLILAAVLGCVAELCGWLIPTISWPFTVSREMNLLSAPGDWMPLLEVNGRFHWFGWVSMLMVAGVGLYLLLRRYEGTQVRAGFIHVPWLPEQGSPLLPLEQTVKALTAAIEAM